GARHIGVGRQRQDRGDRRASLALDHDSRVRRERHQPAAGVLSRDRSLRDHRRRRDLHGEGRREATPARRRCGGGAAAFRGSFRQGHNFGMTGLPVLQAGGEGRPTRMERPPWLKVRLSTTGEYEEVREMMRRLSLVTVCEEARCPNIHECWARERTATFMLMGDVCTRTCGFCAVAQGAPGKLDPEEPARVAKAAAELGLSHAVVTSVNRDDLADGGAAHFAATIRAIRRTLPGCTVEVLIPDFRGDEAALETVLEAEPEVLNHNTETVPRLYRRVRPQARYAQSLELLARADERRLRTGSAM